MKLRFSTCKFETNFSFFATIFYISMYSMMTWASIWDFLKFQMTRMTNQVAVTVVVAVALLSRMTTSMIFRRDSMPSRKSDLLSFLLLFTHVLFTNPSSAINHALMLQTPQTNFNAFSNRCRLGHHSRPIWGRKQTIEGKSRLKMI